MADGNKLVSILVSSVTLFGPFSYLLYAFYESGRLNYFAAPTDFMQLTSFGIMPVVETVHPGIILTGIVATLLGGMRHGTARDKFVMACGVVGYVSGTVWYISASGSYVRWTFGAIATLCGLIALSLPRHTPDIGNEEEVVPPVARPSAFKYTVSIYNGVIIVSAMFFFLMGYVVAGQKKAETQEKYWMAGNKVVLAIYGEVMLLGELNGQLVGPVFEVVESKSLQSSLIFRKVGPLSPALLAAQGAPAKTP
ncbi:hypothetical protein [Pseudomonas protegens]|uniref:hypothetical protein n=1 Tax=Pseudomonas protegens TaxID=380021 RepID=UPI0011B24906|nr:hypothetical protein [Pseudomonas protegens]